MTGVLARPAARYPDEDAHRSIFALALTLGALALRRMQHAKSAAAL